MRVAPKTTVSQDEAAPQTTMRRASHRSDSQSSDERSNLQRLNFRQQELQTASGLFSSEKKTVIDIKFPKKYEEAPEIVNLLIGNVSVLIDFQYMSETQARRCLDYLDGARTVLAGNLKKVSNTMWLLTPVNVMVNIEELRNGSSHMDQENPYDFDMRR
ncbi:DUF552 domain-containing protein [Streptococcus sp. X16XC17]|nr:DUF552 domain-containing protein [Streptococcus sp. X16XC17]